VQSRNTEYLAGLDHLRLLAASIVVLFHTALLASAGRPANPFPMALIDQGHVGVQLFMVISGFIMTTMFADHEVETVKFYINRALRIYPLFVLIVSFGYLATPDPRPTSTGLDFILALLPISNLYRLNYGAFGGQMWTIAVELQFYLLFPLLLSFRRHYGRAFFFSIIGIAIALRATQFAANGTAHTFTFFTLFGNIDLFVGGMVAAEIYQSLKSHGVQFKLGWSIAVLVGAIAVITAAFLHQSFFHVDYHGISTDHVSHSALWVAWPTLQAGLWGTLLVVYLRSSTAFPGSSILANFGKWSYSSYVWHLLVIELLKNKLLWMPSYLLGVAVILPVTLIVSYASYKLIELPFLELRYLYRPKTPQVAPTDNVSLISSVRRST
jgi:peptidoglycan/LPS O-acetylase OafA/YrhL